MPNDGMVDETTAKLFELAKGQLDRQYEAIGRIETKLSVLLGFGFILLGLVLDILGGYPLWAQLSTLITLFLAQVLFALGYHSRNWMTAPNVARVKYWKDEGSSYSEILSDSVDFLAGCFEDNEGIMSKTARLLNLGLLLLFVGTAIAIVTVLAVPPSQ
jgi:hypothetical protein